MLYRDHTHKLTKIHLSPNANQKLDLLPSGHHAREHYGGDLIVCVL